MDIGDCSSSVSTCVLNSFVVTVLYSIFCVFINYLSMIFFYLQEKYSSINNFLYSRADIANVKYVRITFSKWLNICIINNEKVLLICHFCWSKRIYWDGPLLVYAFQYCTHCPFITVDIPLNQFWIWNKSFFDIILRFCFLYI